MPNSPRSNYLYEFTLSRKKVLEMREMPDTRIESPAQLNEVMRSLGLHEVEQEHFVVFFLDAKHHLRGFSTVFVGMIDRCQVHAREVYRNAILNGSARIILAHNHPSNDPTPSAQDIACTRQLVEAGKIIGIEVLDHVIVGEPGPSSKGYVSLREANLM